MRKRLHNHRLVKIHRSYTVNEVAELLGVHKNTVRNWKKNGLQAIDSKRPTLIFGPDLIGFIKKQRARNKHTCKPEELYCVKCRFPKKPDGDMADYLPVAETYGTLKAICPDCGSIMNKNIKLATIVDIVDKIDITLPEDLRHIVKR